jgi:diguanylate cyclase (GGDEF)-like protein
MKDEGRVPFEPRRNPLPTLAQMLRADYGLRSPAQAGGAHAGAGHAETAPAGAGHAGTADAVVDRSATSDYDALTGLPTLAHMSVLIRCLIDAARRKEQCLALALVRLDGFRRHRLQHGDGDAVLRLTGTVLAAEAGHCGSVARVGAGEFLVVLHDLGDAAEAAKPVRRMLDALAQAHTDAHAQAQAQAQAGDAGSAPVTATAGSAPATATAASAPVTATAGIAVFPADGDDLPTLLRKASAATRGGGQPGRDALRFHSSEVDLVAKQRWRLETGLRDAVQRHDLGVHYQPQFELQGGRICGVEALARWHLADGSAVGPSVFIPLAERTGLICDLGAWVLELACGTVSAWRVADDEPPTLCVNVSAHQIDASFPALLGGSIARSGFPAERLELEVAEATLSADPSAAIECLDQWKQLGVRIAVDHFGVGFSSLSHLTRLPIDRLKIDKSLVHSMCFEKRSAAIVRSIISLARELGVNVLAEGVETELQLELLQEWGCEQAQGYLFAQPVPAKEARALLGKSWGRRSDPGGSCHAH